MAFRIVLGLLCLAVLGKGQAEERPLVETKYGKLRGVTVPVKETLKTADSFFSIPFAKPPTGQLRFKNPEAPEPWESIRDASQYPPVCLQHPQYNLETQARFNSTFQMPPVSEDCLYLNVFTPSARGEGSKLPVMVYIHGGGLHSGGASLYDGSALSVSGDVVVVTMNFRLGILEFLSNVEDQLRGNLGFMDQVAALSWVQENIQNFGGDRQSVTIFGQSAGGISVSAHVVSPASRGLFHRAIAQSGTVLMPGVVVSKSEELTVYRQLVSEVSGCDPSSLVKCLMQKSEQEMLEIVKNLGSVSPPITVDGVFLPAPVEEILANKKSNAVPFILGYSSHDFGRMVPQQFSVGRVTEGMSRDSAQRMLQDIGILNLSSNEIAHILDEYLADAKTELEIRDRFLDIGTDRLFAMPALSMAKKHRDSGHPVYLYEFQHSPSMFKDTRPDSVKVDHTGELLDVFGAPFVRDGALLAGEATDDEKNLSKTVMSYWVNFARNGDPNGFGLEKWPRYDAKEGYLRIDLKQKASHRLKEDKFKFWAKLLE